MFRAGEPLWAWSMAGDLERERRRGGTTSAGFPKPLVCDKRTPGLAVRFLPFSEASPDGGERT